MARKKQPARLWVSASVDDRTHLRERFLGAIASDEEACEAILGSLRDEVLPRVKDWERDRAAWHKGKATDRRRILKRYAPPDDAPPALALFEQHRPRLTWATLRVAFPGCFQDLLPIREALESWARRFHMVVDVEGGDDATKCVDWFLAAACKRLGEWAEDWSAANWRPEALPHLNLDEFDGSDEDPEWSTPGPVEFKFPALEWDPRFIDREAHGQLVLADFKRRLTEYYDAKERAMADAGGWRAVASEIERYHLRALIHFHCLGKNQEEVAKVPGLSKSESLLGRVVRKAAQQLGFEARTPDSRGKDKAKRRRTKGG